MDDVINTSIKLVHSLAPYVEPTALLCRPIVTESIQAVAKLIDMDYETTAYALGLFLAYPLGVLMNFVPPGKLKHLFSAFFGVLILQLVLAVQWFNLFFVCTVSYAAFLLLPPKAALYIVPTFAMGYCVLGHLHRQYVNYMGWDLDFTSAMMIVTIKLWMLAHNIADGHVIKTLPEGRYLPNATAKCQAFALSEVPGPLEFYGYLFNFSTVLAGPAFEYRIYADACSGRIFMTSDGKVRRPSNAMPVIVPLVTSLVCMGCHVAIRPYWPVLDPTDQRKNLPVLLMGAEVGGYSVVELGGGFVGTAKQMGVPTRGRHLQQV